MELYPSWVRKLWKEWDLQLMVLLSLTFQILLNFLGNRRKYSNKLWVRVVVWSAYITADSVATFALGILSSNLIELYDKDSSLDANTQLSAFWAPFLVLHLGGPDTITAYALEDNELWLRNLLGLVVQTGMAISIFIMSWTASSLSILSLVMFLPGIIKYGERVWVLRSTTRQKRRQSYRFVLTYNDNLTIVSEEDILRFAKDNQGISSHAFLDDTMIQNIRFNTFCTFRAMSHENAFKVIEILLGMMYDLLYTKAPLLCTRVGLVLRLITFFLTCLVSVLFQVLIDLHRFSRVDLWITTLLILVAVIHDIYAAVLLVLSDTCAIWLIELQPPLNGHPSTSTSRWSNKMSQYNLLRFTSSKAKPWMSFKLLNKRIEMGKYWHCEVSEDIKKLIFEYVKQKAEDAQGTSSFAELPTPRSIMGQLRVIKINIPRKIGRTINDDLELGIIVWHIATEVWYYLDQQQFQNDFRQNCRMIKRVSRYMMYLLVEQPSLLSADGSDDQPYSFRRIRNIVEERILLPSRADKITSNKAKVEACNRLLEKYPHSNFNHFNGEEEFIYQAMELVRKVNHKSQAGEETLESKWKRIESAWLDMLGYAARKCKGNEHAQQLRRGGELLTHVWLLLCYFGLTDHYLIERRQEINRDEEE